MNKKIFLTLLSSFYILNMSPATLVHGMQPANHLYDSKEIVEIDNFDDLENTKNIEIVDDIEFDLLENIEECSDEEFEQFEDIEEFDDVQAVVERLHALNNILESENSLLRIKLEPWQNIYMIGDIHSDIFSLNFIKRFMSQHPYDKYVFLGDYVDRGYYGAEVFMGLADLKINNPDKIYLLRGNHETEMINKIYGFYDELEGKFSDNLKEIYNEFNATFNKLPLAAEIDCGSEKIFCVHGGICPSADGNTLKLKELENLPKENPVELDSIINSLLWSDPKYMCDDFRKNISRNAGYEFGRSAVKKFLDENNLNYIVRAHQTVMEGFEDNFDGTVKTVFSAPHYCGRMDNKGAILGFNRLTKTFNVIKFDISPGSGYSYTQVN